MMAFRRSIPALRFLLGALLLACEDDGLDPAEAGAAATIALHPATATIQIGQSIRLTATVHDAEGALLRDRPVTWTSSNREVATVISGLVTGVENGGALITASADGLNASATITVQLVVSDIQITPESPVIATGTSVQLKATPRSPDGSPIDDRIVEWQSLNPRVATVSVGKVRGLRVGTAEIVATVDDESATTSVSVLPNVNGQWTLTSSFGDAALGISCSTAGPLTLVQSAGIFTGAHERSGSCETPGGTTSISGVSDVLDAGLSAERVDFVLRGDLTCTYRGELRGTPVTSAVGVVTCTGEIGSEPVTLPGSWEMRR